VSPPADPPENAKPASPASDFDIARLFAMPKLLILQGGLYTIIAALTPVATFLISDSPLTVRAIVGLVVIAVIAGATALKAFLSTTFSESSASTPDKPTI
jgi:VIT1/CCC1 family predicted Fe2+/Mn2+ transporter